MYLPDNAITILTLVRNAVKSKEEFWKTMDMTDVQQDAIHEYRAIRWFLNDLIEGHLYA